MIVRFDDQDLVLTAMRENGVGQRPPILMKDAQLLALLERVRDAKVVDAEDGHWLAAQGLATHLTGRLQLSIAGLATLRRLERAQPNWLRPGPAR